MSLPRNNYICPSLVILASRGAEIDVKDERGITPLHSASVRNIPEALHYLIRKKANIGLKSNKGLTGNFFLKFLSLTSANSPSLCSQEWLRKKCLSAFGKGSKSRQQMIKFPFDNEFS
jgi:ankyrin repeat protein